MLTRREKWLIFGGAIGLPLLILLVLVAFAAALLLSGAIEPPTPAAQSIAPPPSEQHPGDRPEDALVALTHLRDAYRTLETAASDTPSSTIVEAKLLLLRPVSEVEMQAILRGTSIQLGSAGTYKYHPHPTAIRVFAFSSTEKAQAGAGQWVAMLTLVPAAGERAPEITFDINRAELRALTNQPLARTRFGLDEATRIRAWQEYTACTYRAADAVTVAFPNPSRDDAPAVLTYQHQIEDQCKQDVLAKYHLSDQQFSEISLEARARAWPLPSWDGPK